MKTFTSGSVLLIDDDSDILELLQDICKVAKRPYYSARNGKEALDLIKDHKDIELIISDMFMPKMSGEELIINLQNQKRKIKTILSSGSSKESFSDILKRKDVEFLQKPYDLHDVLNHIHQN